MRSELGKWGTTRGFANHRVLLFLELVIIRKKQMNAWWKDTSRSLMSKRDSRLPISTINTLWVEKDLPYGHPFPPFLYSFLRLRTVWRQRFVLNYTPSFLVPLILDWAQCIFGEWTSIPDSPSIHVGPDGIQPVVVGIHGLTKLFVSLPHSTDCAYIKSKPSSLLLLPIACFFSGTILLKIWPKQPSRHVTLFIAVSPEQSSYLQRKASLEQDDCSYTVSSLCAIGFIPFHALLYLIKSLWPKSSFFSFWFLKEKKCIDFRGPCSTWTPVLCVMERLPQPSPEPDPQAKSKVRRQSEWASGTLSFSLCPNVQMHKNRPLPSFLLNVVETCLYARMICLAQGIQDLALREPSLVQGRQLYLRRGYLSVMENPMVTDSGS